MPVMYSCAFPTTEDVPCGPLIFLFMYYALFSLVETLLALISVTQGEKREHSDKQIQPPQKKPYSEEALRVNVLKCLMQLLNVLYMCINA